MIAVIFWVGMISDLPGYLDASKISYLKNWSGKCEVGFTGSSEEVPVLGTCEELLAKIKKERGGK